MLEWIRQFLPKRREVFLIFGVVLFTVHSWAIYQYLHKVPSFILHMNLGQMASVLAYMMAFAFLESILVTGAVIFASILIPGRGDGSGLISRAFLMVLVGSFAFVDFMNSLTNKYAGINFLLQKILVAVGIFVILLVITHFIKPLQKTLVFLVEQIAVMTYIYVPIGIISLLVVILRNLI